jgi:hypothetical protein
MPARIMKCVHVSALFAVGCASSTNPLPTVAPRSKPARAQPTTAAAPAVPRLESRPTVRPSSDAATLPPEALPALFRCDPVSPLPPEVYAAHGVTAQNLTSFEAIVRGEVTPVEPRTAVGGALPKRVIQERITQSDVFTCFESALSLWPRLQGRVEVVVLIAPDGAVVRSELSANETGNDGLGCCVRARAMSWTFPPPEGDGVVIVHYPFVVGLRPPVAGH